MIRLRFVHTDPMNHTSAYVQLMAWHLTEGIFKCIFDRPAHHAPVHSSRQIVLRSYRERE